MKKQLITATTLALLIGTGVGATVSYVGAQTQNTAMAQAVGSSTISMGARGQEVVALQTLLEAKGFLVLPPGVAKGYFGSLTKKALMSYQSSNELEPTGSYDSESKHFLTAQSMSSMTSDTNTKAASLRVLLNALNREHANLASIALRKGFDGAKDFAASAKGLDNNSIEIAQSIGAVYGQEAETKFLEIWRSHITFFVNYTLASKANDQDKKAQAVKDLGTYVDKISDFLSSANPNLPREAVHQVVTEHVRLLMSTIDKHFAGDYNGSYTMQHATDVQIGTQIADTIAGAIVKQYPEKF